MNTSVIIFGALAGYMIGKRYEKPIIGSFIGILSSVGFYVLIVAVVAQLSAIAV